MKLISKFRDYYDCGLSWGREESVVYMRLKEEIRDKRLNVPGFAKPWDYQDNDRFVEEMTIGFCGKIYGLLVIFDKNTEPYVNGKRESHLHTFCYNVEDFDRYVEKHYNESEKEYYYAKKVKKRRFGWAFSRYEKLAKHRLFVEEYFENAKEKQDSFADYFIEKKCPIFVVRPDRKHGQIITINDELGPLHFQKVFDPVAAFQELSMYLGGMAAPEKTIPHVSDADLLEAKGFDKKWSFRKEPRG